METYLGQIVYVPWTWTIQNFALCSGQTLPISQYQALFSLLGDNFGGDSVHSFCLPDLRPLDQNGNRRSWEAGDIVAQIALQGVYPSRN